jgi:hypothetical protein
MIDTFEGRESMGAGQALATAPDRGSLFSDARVDDFAVVFTA